MELMVQEFEPVVKQSGLDKAEHYAAIFAPFMITLKELSNKAATINKENPSVLDAKLAREVRLAMVKNRTATEKQKDLSKATINAEGNLIQSLHNLVVNSSKLSEADLESIEKYAENKEKERKDLLATERAAMFAEYGTDLTGYDLGGMADNVFADLLESQKLLHEKRIADAARLEAERIAAEKAELERQVALKAENERLKAEAEIKQRRNDELRPYIVFIRDYTKMVAMPESEYQKELADIKEAAELEWEYQRKEQIKKQQEEEANAEKLRLAELASKKQAAELKAAQDAADKAKAELKAKQEAEAKAEDDRIAAEKKAAKAPVKEKLKVAVSALSLSLPESEITADITAKFSAFKTWALHQIESL